MSEAHRSPQAASLTDTQPWIAGFIQRAGRLSFGGSRVAYIRYKAYLPAVLLALATLVVASTFAAIRVDLNHDGYVLKPVLDVAHGKMLYRDTYSHYGAISVLLPAFLLWLVGDYLLAVKLLAALAYAIIAFLLWLLWVRILPRWLTALTVVSWLLLAPFLRSTFLAWSSVYALLFQLLALYFLVRGFEKKQLPYALIAGVFAAAGFLARHTVGLAEFLTMGVLLLTLALVERGERGFYIRCLTRLAVSFLLTIALLLVWLAANGALEAWWVQTVLGPAKWVQTARGGLELSTLFTRYLFPTWRPVEGVMWAAIPVVTMIVLAREIVALLGSRGAGPTSRVTLLITAVGLSSWQQYYPVPCWRHCFWAASPMLVFIPYLVWSTLKTKLSGLRTFATLTAVVLVFYPAVELRVKSSFKRLREPYVTVKDPAVLAGIRFLPEEARAYEKLSQLMHSYFEANPEGNVVVEYFPLLLTFSPRIRSVHPVFDPAVDMLYEDVSAIYSDYIQKERPLLIAAGVSRPGYKPVAFFAKETVFGQEAFLYAPLPGLYVAAPVTASATKR